MGWWFDLAPLAVVNVGLFIKKFSRKFAEIKNKTKNKTIFRRSILNAHIFFFNAKLYAFIHGKQTTARFRRHETGVFQIEFQIPRSEAFFSQTAIVV
jgi:hypothetical protein